MQMRILRACGGAGARSQQRGIRRQMQQQQQLLLSTRLTEHTLTCQPHQACRPPLLVQQ